MHYLTRQRLHLSLFHPLMKVLMSMYILSVGAGIWVAAMKYTDRGEWSAAGVGEYVHGASDPADDTFGDPFAGATGLAEGKSRRELIDIVHPHLFSVPVVLFILGHLLHLTRLSDVWKLTINVTAFASFLATFLLPFLLLDDTTLAPVLYVTGWLMMISFVALCVIPLFEMWVGRPGRGFDAITGRRRSAAGGSSGGKPPAE